MQLPKVHAVERVEVGARARAQLVLAVVRVLAGLRGGWPRVGLRDRQRSLGSEVEGSRLEGSKEGAQRLGVRRPATECKGGSRPAQRDIADSREKLGAACAVCLAAVVPTCSTRSCADASLTSSRGSSSPRPAGCGCWGAGDGSLATALCIQVAEPRHTRFSIWPCIQAFRNNSCAPCSYGLCLAFQTSGKLHHLLADRLFLASPKAVD